MQPMHARSDFGPAPSEVLDLRMRGRANGGGSGGWVNAFDGGREGLGIFCLSVGLPGSLGEWRMLRLREQCALGCSGVLVVERADDAWRSGGCVTSRFLLGQSKREACEVDFVNSMHHFGLKYLLGSLKSGGTKERSPGRRTGALHLKLPQVAFSCIENRQASCTVRAAASHVISACKPEASPDSEDARPSLRSCGWQLQSSSMLGCSARFSSTRTCDPGVSPHMYKGTVQASDSELPGYSAVIGWTFAVALR